MDSTTQPNDVFLVKSTSEDRGWGDARVSVDLLAENVNIFLTQVEQVLRKTPDDLGKFIMDEFSISAEISASGQLSILGNGVTSTGGGSITFKFVRK